MFNFNFLSMFNLTKTFFLIIFFSFLTINIKAQENSSRVVTTAVPFLTIASDARSSAMGDVGIASSPDVFSQYWNPAKYAFSEVYSGVGISYSPWLGDLVKDIFIGNVVGFYKIDDQSAVGSSFRYFNLGEVQMTTIDAADNGILKPNEFSFDVSYSLMLDDRFSMAVAIRYIRSSIANGPDNPGSKVGQSVAVDIAGYYKSKEVRFGGFDGSWSLGWNISNIGPKISYTDASTNNNFLPTNLRIGGGYNFKIDDENEVSVMLDINKLLVPTPPIYNDKGEIIEGKNTNVGVVKGIFQSFYDAPGGFSEEMNELSYAFGTEYDYAKTFFLRTGYFYEHKTKGARNYATLGVGFLYNAIGLDFSYLISMSKQRSPLENTLRFSLTVDLEGL